MYIYIYICVCVCVCVCVWMYDLPKMINKFSEVIIFADNTGVLISNNNFNNLIQMFSSLLS
jgi:hypothetical protein